MKVCKDLLFRDQEKNVSFELSDHDSALGVCFGNGNFNSEHHVHVLDAENQRLGSNRRKWWSAMTGTSTSRPWMVTTTTTSIISVSIVPGK